MSLLKRNKCGTWYNYTYNKGNAMENIPITIRVPEKQLHILDAYANEKGLSRADLFRNLIIDATAGIEEQNRKERLIAASKKVSKHSLKENITLDITLLDGLNNDK